MRVSVIIPNYNYADFIGGTINSVLNQTEKVDEIIVVDDGSTDNSRSVIESFGDKVIPVFQENSGQASAISMGFSKATGDIICLLDSDDFFFPDKVAIIKKMYGDDQDTNWVFHDLVEIDGKVIPTQSSIGYNPTFMKSIDERGNMVSGKIYYDAPATSGLTFRKSFINALFPLPSAQSIYISDHYIKFYCLAMSKGAHLNQNLGGQLIHGDNLYTGTKQMITRGKIFTNTALALRTKCPDTIRFCNTLFCEGRACLNAVGYKDMNQIVRQYNLELSPLELILLEIKKFIKSRRYKKTVSGS